MMRNHLLFEWPELQESRDKWASLFPGPDTVGDFMWHEDLVSVGIHQ